MTMTVGELRALLDGVDDDAQVHLASQPNYPHEWNVAKLRYVQPNQDDLAKCRDYVYGASQALLAGLDTYTKEDLEEAQAELTRMESVPKILYILEGSYIGYGDRNLWDGED